MWEKIKEFFKKFWWMLLVPIGLFIAHVVLRKETPELDRLIKEKQKEIKNQESLVEDLSKEASKSETALEHAVEDAEAVLEQVSSDSEQRDKKAEEFFR